MANLCNFRMMVRGRHNDIEKFYNAMSQNGTTWMGRGAVSDIVYDDDDNTALIDGWCKWSIQSALIDDAISMRKEPKRWYKLNTNYDYITLWEACEKYNLAMEVYSEEPGCEFQEHYKYENGEIIAECVDYFEYYIDHANYRTKEEFEKEYGISITDNDWELEDYVSKGGFEHWYFSI